MSKGKQAGLVFGVTALIIGWILYGPSIHALKQKVGLAPDDTSANATRAALAKRLPATLAALKRVDLNAVPEGLSECNGAVPSVVLDEGFGSQDFGATWDGPMYRTSLARGLGRAANPSSRLDTDAAKAVEAFLASPRVAVLIPRKFNAPVATDETTFTIGELSATLAILDLTRSVVLCRAPVHVVGSSELTVAKAGSSRAATQKTLNADFTDQTDQAVQEALVLLAGPGKCAELPLTMRVPSVSRKELTIEEELLGAKVVVVEHPVKPAAKKRK